ncbi:MAG TPA: hypothetical protein VFW19_10785 [Allosphingosinicella sp.]|nr:hypothetical protein [Allosphingosinicella sp.]
MASVITSEPRAGRFATKTFAAFRIADDMPGRSYRLAFDGRPRDLEDALNQTKVRCFHKDKLVIRETDELSTAVEFHLFAIKQKSRPRYEYKDHRQVAVRDLYAELICVLPAGVLL